MQVRGQDYGSTVSLARPRLVQVDRPGAQGKRRWTFRFDAPGAQRVCVAGTFNDWHPSSHPMERHPSGCWFAEFKLPRGRHEYRFVVDGDWRDDPNASDLTPNHCGGVNAVVALR